MWSWALYLILVGIGLWFVAKTRYFKIQGLPQSWIITGFLVKLLVGFIFYWVYTEHYTSGHFPPDAIRYVNDATAIAQLLPEHPDVFGAIYWGYSIDDPLYAALTQRIAGWQSGYLYGLTNDCATIIRINVPIAFISRGFFPIHALVFSMLSLLGSLWMLKAFAIWNQKAIGLAALVGVVLLPTPLFWTSAPTKEAALLPVFGGILYLISLWQKGQWQNKYFLWLIPLCPGLVFIKQYVLIALLPGIVFLALQQRFRFRAVIKWWGIVLIACYALAQHAHYFFIGGDFLYVIQKKLTDFTNVAYLQQAGSFVYVPTNKDTLAFISHYPSAFGLTYLRPYCWEIKSLMYIPFAAENLLVMYMLARLLFSYKRPSDAAIPFLLLAATTVLALAAIIGNTVPILGAVIRYRTPGFMLLWLLCLVLTRPPKWQKLLQSKLPH